MDDPFILIFAVLVLAAIGLRSVVRKARRFFRRPGRSRWRKSRKRRFPYLRIIRSGEVLNGDSQIVHVRRGNFQRQPLMNQIEFRTFKTVQRWVHMHQGASMQVFAQVPMGEVLACADDLAFRAINSKRVDLLVINSSGLPLIAVEVQGGGHFQGNAVMRDAVKRIALASAGIELVEVFPADGEGDVFGKLDAARDAVISRLGN